MSWSSVSGDELAEPRGTPDFKDPSVQQWVGCWGQGRVGLGDWRGDQGRSEVLCPERGSGRAAGLVGRWSALLGAGWPLGDRQHVFLLRAAHPPLFQLSFSLAVIWMEGKPCSQQFSLNKSEKHACQSQKRCPGLFSCPQPHRGAWVQGEAETHLGGSSKVRTKAQSASVVVFPIPQGASNFYRSHGLILGLSICLNLIYFSFRHCFP